MYHAQEDKNILIAHKRLVRSSNVYNVLFYMIN